MDFRPNQIRFARHTNQLAEIKRFYAEGLGLPEIGSFLNHEGYSGIMLGLPDASVHLEFTQHAQGSSAEAPGPDNLLVFYFSDTTERNAIAQNLLEMGYPEVEPENPYWKDKAITIEDPDGWRVVLVNQAGFNIDKQ